MDYESCSVVTVPVELSWPHLSCLWLPNGKTAVGISLCALGMDYKQTGQARCNVVGEVNALILVMGDLMPVLQDLIPEVIHSQKCYVNVDHIVNAYGVMCVSCCCFVVPV
jgi:hypothetical protein